MINNAARSGVLVGVISIVVALLIYIIDATLFIKWWLGLSLLVINLGLISYFGIQYRKEIGGFMSFGEAFKYSILVFIVAGFLGTFFNVILFNVIDPELPELLTDASVEQTEKMLNSFGTPDDAKDEALQKVKEDTPASFTPLGQLKNFGIAIILYAIFSLITAAIIKRKEPELEL